jgi:HTH-type transcriptional regulator / antitoxin HigA
MRTILAARRFSYEEQHYPIGPPHPMEMIRHRMRTAGCSQADLADLLGSRARASEVPQKKRRLTPMIWKLSREWKLPAETLIAPYALAGKRPRHRTVKTARRKAA